MPKTPDTRQTLYGTSREMLETAERKNEILAEIAGEEYTAPESIPHAQYSIDKRMLAAKQKENELLESIAGGGEGSVGANKLAIDYATDVLSLKRNDTPITGSGVTLPAYGINYDSGTGGLTLTKNGAPVQGQTVSLPPYGAPQKAATASAMTDTSKVYVYTGSESGYNNGDWYYYDETLEAWTSGGVYNSQGIETDKTLLVEGAPADAKATGDVVGDLETQVNTVVGNSDDITSTDTISNKDIGNDVTANYTNGKLTLYGTANAVRAYMCLNGQNFTLSQQGNDFRQTLAPGTYKVNLSQQGGPDGLYRMWATPNKFNSGDQFYLYDGDAFHTDVPLMVGFKLEYNVNYGTSESPTYLDISINQIKEKQNKLTFDSTPTENSTNPVTSGGIYDAFHSALILDSTAVKIPANSDIHSYTTPGTYKITNKDDAESMTNLPVALPGKLVVLETSQPDRVIHIYFVNNTSIPAPTYFEYYGGSSWSEWDRYARNSQITSIINRLLPIEKTVNVLYEPGTWGKGTNRLTVYVPVTDGYIAYKMYHYIDDDPNSDSYKCDCREIAGAWCVNDSFGSEVKLTESAEWECAIHLKGRRDFSGGHMHGDEVMTAITVLMDGIPVDMTTLTERTKCNTLRIIRTSTMYDPEDHPTSIATHGVEYVFDKENGLTVNQTLIWEVAADLTDCYLCMFPPSKNYIDRASANSDFEIITLPSSKDAASIPAVVKNNATKMDMWDTETGLSAEVSVPVYPTGKVGGDQSSISDNNGKDYNKLYFKVCGDVTSGGVTTYPQSSAGELWKSTSIYKLDFKTAT